MTGSKNRLILTGASGLLGRAIFTKFQLENWNVCGFAFSRVGPGLKKVDLGDPLAVEESVTTYKPHFIIHCAAQRFPDKVDSDPEAASRLNVDATRHLAQVAAKLNVPMLYISTDYVFDGTSPPYKIQDLPNPLNLYGKTKLQGEEATLTVNQDNVVLRIPVLYGPVEQLSESAVTVLLGSLLDSTKPCKVSDYERRRPSHVDDIAEICYRLTVQRLLDCTVKGVFHWCGREELTKYGMVLAMAAAFHLPHHHMSASRELPTSSSTPRPFDTTLDTSRLDQLGIGRHTPFSQGIESALRLWLPDTPQH